MTVRGWRRDGAGREEAAGGGCSLDNNHGRPRTAAGGQPAGSAHAAGGEGATREIGGRLRIGARARPPLSPRPYAAGGPVVDDFLTGLTTLL